MKMQKPKYNNGTVIGCYCFGLLAGIYIGVFPIYIKAISKQLIPGFWGTGYALGVYVFAFLLVLLYSANFLEKLYIED